MKAYHGNPLIKSEYVERMRAHREADQLLQGYGYWKDGKGCAVGCTIHSNESDRYKQYEVQIGVPDILARLEESIFEGSDPEFAKQWPERFLEAIEPGSDLSLVWAHFAKWLLIDPEFGVLKFAKTERRRKAIENVAQLYDRWIGGDKPPRDEWVNAADAADASADASAAYASASAASAASAAYASAAYASAAAAAAADASAAAAAASYAAARIKARRAQGEKLLELLKSAPVNGGTQ